MEHKRQHYVPRCYLQEWCDPECPEEQTPYVWLFSKDGAGARKKSPEKIFCETDFYTVKAEAGQRDLTIEHNLSHLEGKFAKIRKDKLNQRLPISQNEELLLFMFIMAMYGRTKAQKIHWSQQWKNVLELGEHFQQVFDTASDEARARLTAALSDGEANKENSLSLEDVRQMAEQPLEDHLSVLVTEMAPVLGRIPYCIIEAPVGLEFITSDAPCVWYVPDGPLGLASPDIEITMPISPNQMIFFGKKLIASGIYMPLSDESLIEGLNKRTRLCAHEYFVFHRNEIRARWF